jgi:RNA polymerase sigma-70 factor (ECF subfamily)
LLKDEARAQDAAQEIFIKIFTNLAKFNKKSKFSTWVYSITYNFCIDVIRKSKKQSKLFSDEEAEGQEIVEEIDDKVLLEMELERLKTVLDLLNVDDKSVLIMKYKEGLSIKEISEVFDKTESAIKMKIKRAKHKCQQKYLETFPVEEEFE